MRHTFRTLLWFLGFVMFLFFLIILKPYSEGDNSVQSAYPLPNPTPTPQVTATVSAYPPPAQGQGITLQQDSTQLTNDAKMYASFMGVDLKEAVRRLKLQDDIDELNSRLTAGESDTFGGLWIQHKPDYRIIVLFTGNGEATI